MNKFTHIETIAADMIEHSFEMDLQGVPSKSYVMIHNDVAFSVITPLDENDPRVLMFCIDKEKSESVQGHYEGLFECECVIKGVMERLASDECMCPECQKEQRKRAVNSNKIRSVSVVSN
ncbi:hypothetical protein GM879_00480 [Escherichia coli]|nr:hypothetical protein [Escherichia coli]